MTVSPNADPALRADGTIGDPPTTTLAEWDWVVIGGWDRLHHAARFDDPDGDAYDEHGRTSCGREGWLSIPGMFARLGGTARCAHCCRIVGFPQGIGSPKNDAALRPLVEQRIRKLVGE